MQKKKQIPRGNDRKKSKSVGLSVEDFALVTYPAAVHGDYIL
jgi:hypothetical protein